MTDRLAHIVAWALAALSLACVAVAFAVVIATGAGWQEDVVDAPLLVLAFGGVGLRVVLADGRSQIGWLLLTIGVAVGVYTVMTALIAWDETRDEPFPGAGVNALFHGTIDVVALGVLIPRVLLLFPTGRPPTPRWRVVGWAQLATLAMILLGLFVPGPLEISERRYDNPFGIGALDWLDSDVANVLTSALLPFGALGAVASIVFRFRASRGVERLQLKWVAWGVGAMGAVFVLNGVLVFVFDTYALAPLLGFALCLFPVTVGIAILRYGLFEIDRVISKTLVYAGLTVLLGAAYVGLVLAGQAAFSSVAGGSNLAIAASTLVVAALFLPMRARVQGFVDRRFYRRRYDAQRTLDAFGSRLREQVELDVLRVDLEGVVRDTMQPAHVALWLRQETVS